MGVSLRVICHAEWSEAISGVGTIVPEIAHASSDLLAMTIVQDDGTS